MLGSDTAADQKTKTISRARRTRRGRPTSASLPVIVGVLTLGLLMMPEATGQTAFDPPVDIWMPSSPRATQVADIDGDGDNDFVTSLDDGFVVTVNPGGVVLGAEFQVFVPYVAPNRIVADVGDINGDGRVDILVRPNENFTTPQPLTIHAVDALGRVSVTSLPALPSAVLGFPAQGWVRAAVIVDPDGDGDQDVVFASAWPTTALWAYPNFGGTLSTNALPVDYEHIHGIAAADFDGDGGDDLVYAHRFGGVRVYDPDIGYTFGTSHQIPRVSAPITGDFDGDGAPDIAYIHHDASQFSFIPDPRLQVILNNGQGGFPTHLDLGVPNPALILEGGDLDGDGCDEIVVNTFQGPTIVRVTPTAQGPTLVLGESLDDTYDADITIADLDGDGDQDVVTSSFALNRVRVHLNRLAPTPNFRTIEVLSSSPSAVSGMEYTTPFALRLTEPDGTPVANESITVVSATGAIATPAVLTTDVDGIASFTADAGTRPPFDEFRFHAYRAHPTGVRHETTVIPTHTMTITAGDGQTAPIGTPFPTPLEVHVVDAVTGHAAAGIAVTFTSNPSGGFAPSEAVVTDVAGRASVTYSSRFGSVQPQSVVAQADGAPAVEFNLGTTFLPPGDIGHAIVSGNLQTTAPGQSWADPLVIRATDSTGAPIFGLPVMFTSFSAVTLSPAATTTDIDGFASTTATAQSQIGVFTVDAGTTAVSVPFDLTVVAPYTLSLVSSPPRFVTAGALYGSPVVVRLIETSTSIPVVGETLVLTGGASPMLYATTDTNGEATFQPTAGPFTGPGVLTVDSALSLPVNIPVFHRSLTVTSIASADVFVVVFRNDAAGVPITLVADAPLPASNVVSTIFGDIHTSILAPGPSLVAFDGLGLLGPPDPSVVANPNFVRTMAFPGLVGSGVTATFQVYGIDASQPYPLNGFVSNPVTFTF